jgi:predicted nucleic acid-binding protein
MDRKGLASQYETLIAAIPNLAIVEIDRGMARLAAALRARHRLRTADALQIATSLQAGATAFVTNDIRLRRVNELEVIVLADFVE